MNKKQLKALFAKILLPIGYSNIKDMFFRRVGDIFLIVDLQKSSFGGMFFVNIGFFVNEEADITQPPPYYETHMQQRLISIVPQAVGSQLLTALNLETSMKDEERSSIITAALEQHGLPYLNSLSTIEGIADCISPGNRNIPLVTLKLREIISRRTGRNFLI